MPEDAQDVKIQAIVGGVLRTFATEEELNAALVADQQAQDAQVEVEP